MVYIAPDYTLRYMCSHPEFVGIQTHKAFRTIYKWPRFIDRDLHAQNVVAADGYQAVIKMPTPYVNV